MTAEEIGLLNDIHADPRSDVKRLLLANWLKDNGHPELAAFIRIQCEPPYIRLEIFEDDPVLALDNREVEPDDERIERAIALLRMVPSSANYPKFHQYYSRGLLRSGMELDDDHLCIPAESLLPRDKPFYRFDATVRTPKLGLWLAHPVMMRVDVLRVVPDIDPEAELDEDDTINSHRDAFWEENIPVLAASPLIDWLEELHPQGCHSVLGLTDRSRRNIELCERLLEPRVYVEYSH